MGGFGQVIESGGGGATGGVLVTGATGFIGQSVVRAFSEAGFATRALVRSAGGRSVIDARSEIVRGDLARADSALAGIGTVVHLAYDFRSSGGANLRALDLLLDAMVRRGVRRLVHASSVVVHDGWPMADLTEAGPITPTGEVVSYRGTKIAMEAHIAEAVAARRLDMAVLLRPTLVYGFGSRMWTDAVVERLRAGTVILPDPPADHPPDQPFGLCHLCHVEDLAAAAVAAATRWQDGLHSVLLSEPDPPNWDLYYRLHAEVLGRGEVRTAPFEEIVARLPAVSGGQLDTGPGSAALASAALRRILGHSAVDRFGRLMRRTRESSGGLHYPNRFLLNLYSSTGRIDVSKAARELDYRPAKSVAARIRDIGVMMGRSA